MTDQFESVQDLAQRILWAIRHWCAGIDAELDSVRTDAILPVINDQEASLIEALRARIRDRHTAHLIYADWLDERGIGTAAIAHRLAAEGFKWKIVYSQSCFIRGHIFGMHDKSHRFLDLDQRPSSGSFSRGIDARGFAKVGTWLVPLDDVVGPKMPHAEYVGSFNFQTVICKINQVAWQLRDFCTDQKEST